MTTLKNLKGTAIQFLDADPVVNVGSWASANNTNSSHSGYGGSSGTYTAALVAANEPYGANVELYDGTSWTETGDLSTARTAAFSAGTQPATWLGGGRTGPGSGTNNTETFNGSSWTEVNEMNTSRFSSGSAGTYTAGIAFAGNTFTDISRAVETWNGTSWSTHPNDYDSDVADIIAFGTSTAAITAGGFDGPAPRGGSNTSIATSYSYNGSVYTAITAMPQTLSSTTGSGSQTDGLVSGGNRYPAADTANTISWNGTVWSQEQDVPVAVYGWGASKATTDTQNQLIFCGAPGQLQTTVEWSFPPPTASIVQEGDMWFNSSSSTLKGYGTAAGIPAATWASQTSMNTARNQSGSSEASPSSQGVIVGGNEPPQSAKTELWNGSAWTETSDLNVARRDGGSGGVYTSMGFFGGTSPAGPDRASNELWNGSSWTEAGDLNSGRQAVRGSGSSSTSLLCFGGGNPSYQALTEQFDGTSWTEVNDMNTAREANPGSGTVPTTLCCGGIGASPSPGAAQALTELFDGTSWTEVSDLNDARWGGGTVGNSSIALTFGGDPPSTSYTANTEFWNGSTWTEVANLSTATGWTNGFGSAVSAIKAGGYTTTQVATVEEWTASAAVATVTTS